jgi:lysophospholipase L1-like esterase
MYGGVPVNNGNFWAYTVFRRRSVVEGGTSMRVGFITDAPKFAIATSNNSDPNTRVEIDGRYYSVGDIPYTTGATYNWLLFDFSAGQQRKTRLVIRDSAKSGSGQFGGVAVSALDTVWAPPTADDVKVIFIGDSMLAGSGYGPYICGGDVPQILGRLLGWSDVQNWGVGGTGWTSATADYTYGQRIADSSNLATLATADVVLFQGSTNDFGSSSATVAAAVTSALTAVRSANANCLIIVFGVWPTNSASVPTVETGISNGVSAFGDPRTFFLPIYGDTPLPWVTGAWNNSADTNSVNATMWLSGDGTHPPDLGSIYMAQRMARAIRTSVLPVI